MNTELGFAVSTVTTPRATIDLAVNAVLKWADAHDRNGSAELIGHAVNDLRRALYIQGSLEIMRVEGVPEHLVTTLHRAAIDFHAWEWSQLQQSLIRQNEPERTKRRNGRRTPARAGRPFAPPASAADVSPDGASAPPSPITP
jgi:hypothetical protein